VKISAGGVNVKVRDCYSLLKAYIMRKINAVVMTLAGGLLIVASLLKAHEVLTVYFPSWREHGLWESWEFFLVQIPVEFALGVWMVSGVFRKAAWLAGTLAYMGFIGVTLHKILIGAESCGCFGRVEVNPWITLLAIDVPFVLLLLIFRPKGLKLFPPPWPHPAHALAAAGPIFAALIFAAPLLVAFRPEFIKPEDWTAQGVPLPQPLAHSDPTDSTNGATEPITNPVAIQGTQTDLPPAPVVEPAAQTPPVHTDPTPPEPQPDKPAPDQPITEPSAKPAVPITETKPDAIEHPTSEPATEPKREPEPQSEPASQPQTLEIEAPPLWPWLEYVDIADQLKEGLVIVYMYHHDCPLCAGSVPKYEAYHKEMMEMGNEDFKIAYLAIPPYGQGPVPEDTTCLQGKLTDQRKWAITSPFVVALLDGSVVRQWPQGQAPEPDKILDEIFAP
jgi:hypothetical protein